MIDAMLAELNLRQSYNNNEVIDTIYFGGGTPSLLSIDSIHSFLNLIQKAYPIADDCEITLEANPDDITADKVTSWHATGINRISLGIQSFHEDDLHFMNRAHTSAQAEEALGIILNSSISRITADIIFGYQGLTDQKLIYNVEQLTKEQVHHLSCYSLTIEPKTVLHHQVKTGQVRPLEDDIAAEQFSLIKSILQDNNYDHYEISNYARQGEYALHNTNYWKHKSYLGIGPSAHSYNGHSRQWNVANNQQYIKAMQAGTSFYEEEILSVADQYNEYIMTGLRTKWGVNIDHMKNLGEHFVEHFKKEAKELIELGQLEQTGELITISEQAQVVCDSISSQLFFV